VKIRQTVYPLKTGNKQIVKNASNYGARCIYLVLGGYCQQSSETSDPVHGIEGFDQLSDCQLPNEIKDKRTIHPKKRLGLKT